MRTRLIVHGGAWNIPDELCEAHIRGVSKAVQVVAPLLENGLSALDAVEQAVNILESDPTFDAGKGAFLNDLGEVELDAMIMDGQQLGYGAVAAVQNLMHPVSLARQVMEQSEHCLLVGKGAQRFARSIAFPEVAPEDLLTDRELEYFRQIKNNPDFKTHHPFESNPMDTVGAVAMDQNGNIAAATSTGGTPRKLAGRVGDSPLIGAGAYADNLCGGASATGWGESIMKVLLSKTVCDAMNEKGGMLAAKEGIDILKNRVGGLGGIIGIDRLGNYAFAHNTPRMAFAYIQPDQTLIAKMNVEIF